MYTKPARGDLVHHIRSGRIAKVTEVNNRYGWFSVEYADGCLQRYTMSNEGNYSFTQLTAEQKADYLLKLERRGITTSWSED